MTRKTLIIAAHMDDEVLSTGGLIDKHVGYGRDVHVLTAFGRKYADAPTGHLDEAFEVGEKRRRQSTHFRAAQDVLGFKTAEHLLNEEGEPFRVGHYQLLERIEETISLFQPTTVVIPGRDDLNQDHRHLHDICKIVLRPANRAGIKQVLESISHDRFNGPSEANYAVALTSQGVQKVQAAMTCYQDEMRPTPHPRSLLNIEARYRFYGAQFGVEFAEPYRLLVEVE